jgi:hypothetical protein
MAPLNPLPTPIATRSRPAIETNVEIAFAVVIG